MAPPSEDDGRGRPVPCASRSNVCLAYVQSRIMPLGRTLSMRPGSHRRWARLVLLAIVLWADDASSVPLNKLGMHLFPSNLVSMVVSGSGG
jgi:hypothetical protein